MNHGVCQSIDTIRFFRYKTSMTLQRALSGVLIAVILAGCSPIQPKTPTPTITPSPTLIPSQTPTPTATPTLTPTPTPLPAAQLAKADHALWIGDYDLALDEYKTALAASPEAEIAAKALFGIGRIQVVKGDYPTALETLRRIDAEYPDTTSVIRWDTSTSARSTRRSTGTKMPPLPSRNSFH